MKKYIVFLLSVLFSLTISFEAHANEIDNINIHIDIKKDGSVEVTEERNQNMDDGTENYIVFNEEDMQGTKLTQFSVDGFKEVKEWDSDWKRDEKAGKYSILNTDDGFDLVWGIGEYGDKTYTVHYTLTNMVKNLKDGQSIYWDFNTFTELQPIIMSMLIALVFSFIIISPISTVATALAIGISGLAAGSASLGIVACEGVLVAGTMKINRSGVPITIFLGGVKMMIPNMVRHPIILLPIFTNALITGFFGALLGIAGTKESAGFGIIGLVGPISAFRHMEAPLLLNLLYVFIAFFVVPFMIGFLIHMFYMKVLKLYNKEVFKFLA